MRLRKPIWREIKQVLRVDAPIRIQQMETLIEKIFQNEKAKSLCEDWAFELNKRPQKHLGYKLDGGNIIMGIKSDYQQ